VNLDRLVIQYDREALWAADGLRTAKGIVLTGNPAIDRSDGRFGPPGTDLDALAGGGPPTESSWPTVPRRGSFQEEELAQQTIR
jgi:hypothetical protein